MRLRYQERRDALCEALQRHLGGAVTFEAPRGGIALWGRLAPDLDADAWARACVERGVVLIPGRHMTFDGADPGALRLVFSSLTPAELHRAIRIAAGCLPGGLRTERPGSTGGPGA
jgi:GntR family transcriptional regulator/MocR family aminotransferase